VPVSALLALAASMPASGSWAESDDSRQGTIRLRAAPGGKRRLKDQPHAYHELKVQVLNWWHCGHSKVRSSVSSSRGIIVISVICVEVICVEHSGQAGRRVTPWTEGMRVVAGMRCTLTNRQEPPRTLLAPVGLSTFLSRAASYRLRFNGFDWSDRRIVVTAVTPVAGASQN
jgi:hypothetical protein